MSRLYGSPTEIAEQLETLTQTLQRIESIQNRLTPIQLTTYSLDKGRTPIQILAHLRACADLWSYTIYAILATNEEPILAHINAHRWAASHGYTKTEFATSFNTFKANRLELVQVLQDLPQDSWRRTAQISERQHSIYSQAKRMALHEISHCKELESMAERCADS